MPITTTTPRRCVTQAIFSPHAPHGVSVAPGAWHRIWLAPGASPWHHARQPDANSSPSRIRIPTGVHMTFLYEGPLSPEAEQELMEQLIIGDDGALRVL